MFFIFLNITRFPCERRIIPLKSAYFGRLFQFVVGSPFLTLEIQFPRMKHNLVYSRAEIGSPEG